MVFGKSSGLMVLRSTVRRLKEMITKTISFVKAMACWPMDMHTSTTREKWICTDTTTMKRLRQKGSSNANTPETSTTWNSIAQDVISLSTVLVKMAKSTRFTSSVTIKNAKLTLKTTLRTTLENTIENTMKSMIRKLLLKSEARIQTGKWVEATPKTSKFSQLIVVTSNY